MQVDSTALTARIEGELANVPDERVTSYIRRLLITPNMTLRSWDYGEPGQRYPCWTVLIDNQRRDTGIAYCASGFGPKCPWGLVWLGDDMNDQRASMGMDSAWFPNFVEAFFDSFAATELPIWRVFKEQPDGVRTPITDEGEWNVTWRKRDAIQAGDRAAQYHCGHSVPLNR